jgi:hypothetical protein
VKNLFEPARVADVKARIAMLRPDSPRQWGKMTIGQMLAHCSIGFETANGTTRPPRALMGRLLGPMVKRMAVRDDGVMQKNSPTAKVFLITGERDFTVERDRLVSHLDEFAAAGPASCTDHPHAFFGKMTPDEWAILMYKHVDHHLRQFGA